MLRKRIIFTLIYSEGKFNQSRNFRLQCVGGLQWLKMNYKFNEIAFSLDELVILDASKESKDIDRFSENLESIVQDVFIPVAVGGGIKTIEHAKKLFSSGADKLILNTALSERPELVLELVDLYGSQSIVASIDFRTIDNQQVVFVENGTKPLDVSLEAYVKNILGLGIGEVYLNSIDMDGTGFGYDLKVINKIASKISVPLIVAGGAGNENHLIEGLQHPEISAVATANLFNFIGDGLPNARQNAINSGCNLARWI